MKFFWLSLLSLTSLSAESPHLSEPDVHKHLMLDSRVILRSVNAQLVPGTVNKDSRNPLFQNDKPWENALNNLYPNVLWDEQEQIFKLWYKCVLADKDVIAKMEQPATIHEVGWYLLYATSKDGITWDKPALGLYKFNGDAATNIVARDTPNVGVFKDLHDSDASRRYKMIYDVGLGKPLVRFSADGIHWSDPMEALGAGARDGDTHNNAFWDERSGKYLWFTKKYLGERLVTRLESDDFIHWEPGGIVLRSSIEEGRDHQVYCLPVFRYANVYLGYAMIYNVGAGRTVDCELAWSPDSKHWQRITPGIPLIPRGGKGSYDSECIYAMSGPPLVQGNDLLIYYGGDHMPHLGWKRSCLPCVARLPLDHFAGLEQVDKTKPATLFSALFTVTGKPLQITADAGEGMVRIAAIDESGASVDNALDVTGHVIDEPVKWRHEGLTGWKGKRLHLQFELTGNARIYAFSGLEMVNTALPEPLNPLKSPYRKIEPVAARSINFDKDVQGWKGVDKIEHHLEGGARGGYVSISRGDQRLPIAWASAKPEESALVGDWTRLFGGNGAEVRFQVRTQQPGGRVRLEIFAGDVAQWSHETESTFTTAWAEVSATLRYDWSDEEAMRAGWTRAEQGFPWSDTIQKVGKLVITTGGAGARETFDLDELTVSGQ
ncbi:hypothetical protein BH11VER1_BH11VER1_22380 [soil metagenome]